MKQRYIYGAVAVLVCITVFALSWKFWQVFQATPSLPVIVLDDGKLDDEKYSEEISLSRPNLKCLDNEKEYFHDVLGIAFCYPVEWGAPSTAPIKNLTRLANMEETFKEQNIRYENTLDIVFENKEVRLKIFNDRYDGKSERGINEPSEYKASGSTDQVVKLRDDGDICSYETSFKYRYSSEMMEQEVKTIFSECSNGVKAALTDSDYIGYDLKLLSFKKLGNGYFENVLVSQSISSLIQERENLASFGNFLSNETTKRDGNPAFSKVKGEYRQERVEFERFIGTMTAFKPVPKTQVEFKQIPGEDTNITTIRKYYWLIASGKLNEAYSMIRVDGAGATRDEFQERYKNVYSAEPSDFKKMEKNRYKFLVRYQDHNSIERNFHVIMDVVNASLRTHFLEEYMTDIVSSGDMTAYSARRGDQNYVLLNKKNEEKIIDQGDADYDSDYKNIMDVKHFRYPYFSPRGNYFVYTMFGWEWSFGYIYDIRNEKKISGVVAEDLSGAHTYNFTPDEKNFYMCSSSGLSSGSGGKVYSVPGFKVVYDVMNDPENKNQTNVDCSYNEDTNSISFALSDSGFSFAQVRRVEYNLTVR